MSNVYRFIYDSDVNDSSSKYPEATNIKVRHYFSDEASWPVVLYQFCKFLENVGYIGVTEKVIIKDKYGVHPDCGFETIGEEQEVEDDLEDLDWEAAFPKDNQDKDAN